MDQQRTMLNKVPQITAWFWVIKIMATTVGETAADLLAVRMHLGLTVTSIIMSGLFVLVLLLQLRSDRYHPPLYWLAVVMISVVGTLVSDNLVDGLGVSLITTSIVFALALAAVFTAWFRSERTLSIHTIVTPRRERFYWAAILFTFAMGTSVGDLLAERLNLGYASAAIVFAAMILAVALVYRARRGYAILAFWLAYILTRPLGASIGDFLSKPAMAGGQGWGTVTTSLVFLGVIVLVVAYLLVSKADRIATPAAAPSRASPHPVH